MLSQKSYDELKELVMQALLEDQGLPVSVLAENLGVTEGEATLALPTELMLYTDGTKVEALLNCLPSWGNVTTIVHSHHSIFEFKGQFPKGQVAHGYYNMMGKERLHGHLRIDLIKYIAFVSKPFRGTESHYIGFYTEQGNCIFKVYVGRNKKRQLIAEQVAAFQTLKQEYCV